MASKLPKHLNNFYHSFRVEKILAGANQNKLIIAYKLLFDVLFLSLLFFTFALVAEGVLPGIISAHIGLAKIVVFIFLLLIAVYLIGKNIDPKLISQTSANNKKTVITLLFLAILLIINAQLKLNIALNLFVSAIAVIIGYAVYKIILEE